MYLYFVPSDGVSSNLENFQLGIARWLCKAVLHPSWWCIAQIEWLSSSQQQNLYLNHLHNKEKNLLLGGALQWENNHHLRNKIKQIKKSLFKVEHCKDKMIIIFATKKKERNPPSRWCIAKIKQSSSSQQWNTSTKQQWFLSSFLVFLFTPSPIFANLDFTN